MSSASSAAVGHKRTREQPAVAAEMLRRVQPRHFHTGPNPLLGEDMLAALEDNASTPPPTSATRLYRHALESVFAFCSLKELATVLEVSKEWASAVRSMRPLLAALPDGTDASDARLWHFCMSQLARHVGIATVNDPLSAWTLHTFSVRMPNLEELNCSIEDFWSSLVFPARLVALDVGFITRPGPDKLSAAIAAIATLPRLEKLSLAANKASSCSLSALVRAPALHTLELDLRQDALESPANIDALRNMPHLRSLNFHPSPAAFSRLLQPPHPLKLETLDVRGPFTSEYGASIVHLSSLMDLRLKLCSEHTDFLRQLPNLRRLDMRSFGSLAVPSDAGRIIASLHSLTGLTELRVDGYGTCPFHFTSAHLAACLPHMPLLIRLRLSAAAAVDSLRFLSSGPITRSLRTLALVHSHPTLPLRELAHVHALSSLTELMLIGVFDRPLDEYTRSLYTPPSLLLPSLLKFID